MKASKLLSKIVIFALTLCIALGVTSLFVACGTSDEDAAITLSDTAIEVQVDKTKRLTATTIDGGKVTWSSADTSIATVAATGTVKGIKPGKTTITATSGEHTASCQVTVIDTVTVEISKETLELKVGEEETITATASNNGKINWSSSNPAVATVADGKITALKGGTAEIYAECVGTRAVCTVTVDDPSRKSIQKLAKDSVTAVDTMFYFDVDQEGAKADPEDVYYSAADKTYHAKFTNGWSWYSFQLFYKHNVEGANNTVSFKLTSNQAGAITVCGNVIVLKEGENAISIDGFTGFLDIQFGVENGQVPDIKGEAEIALSDLKFDSYTPVALDAPTGLTVTGKTVSITDDKNGDKVKSYKIVFYSGANKAGEVDVEKNGAIDDSAIAKGTYTLAVYAYSTGRYTNSPEFKPEPAVEYTVTSDIGYNMMNQGEDGITNNKWFYWKKWGEVTEASVEGNKVKVSFTGNTGDWFNIQLFYAETGVDKSKNNKITFTLKSSANGHITVNGNVIEITEENIGKAVEYTVYNVGTGKATVSIQMGYGNTTDISAADMEFTFGSPVAVPYNKVKLAAPTVEFGENYAYTITDPNDGTATVDGYNFVFYSGSKAVSTVNVTAKTGTLDIASVATGDYTVKVVAVGSGLYASSDESAGVALNVVNAAGIKYNLAFNEEAKACSSANAGKWWFWNNQGWVDGTTVTMVGTPKYDNGTITIAYTSTGNCTFGLQMFYKDTAFAAGKKHKFSMKITAEKACTITVNGKAFTLKAGEETTIEVTSAEPGADKASVSIQFAVDAEHNANSFTMSDISLVEAA